MGPMKVVIKENTAISQKELFIEADCSILVAGAQYGII